MEKSAIILAGGSSTRFGQDKGLLTLMGKPLIRHVLDAISSLISEEIVVVSSQAQLKTYAKALGSSVNVLADENSMHAPLVGALTGFAAAKGTYSLLLACDTPLISKNVLTLLLDLCTDKAAAIPRWPNCQIEPLHAAYHTRSALEAARSALGEGKLNMQSMVDKLHGVRYISTLVIQQLDPRLETFFNINSPIDLKTAEKRLKAKTHN